MALDGVTDAVAAVVPIGLFLGRVANFIKPELWGRPTDVPWAMVFPGSDGQPRHPSQLYEAGLEGLALFALLWIVIVRGGLRRDGLVTALFCIGYALARIVSETFRQPDLQLGYFVRADHHGHAAVAAAARRRAAAAGAGLPPAEGGGVGRDA